MKSSLPYLLVAAVCFTGCVPEPDISNLSDLNDRFTKLDGAGEELAVQDNAWNSLGSEAALDQWSCVYDAQTGLTWEVKTDHQSLAATETNNTYTWYEYVLNEALPTCEAFCDVTYSIASEATACKVQCAQDNDFNGDKSPDVAGDGKPDTWVFEGISNAGACYGSACDTYSYVQHQNSVSFCGSDSADANTTWRLPTPDELESLVICVPEPNNTLADGSAANAEQALAHCESVVTAYTAQAFFPNTRDSFYWSDTRASEKNNVKTLDFGSGKLINVNQNRPHAVRLVKSAR